MFDVFLMFLGGCNKYFYVDFQLFLGGIWKEWGNFLDCQENIHPCFNTLLYFLKCYHKIASYQIVTKLIEYGWVKMVYCNFYNTIQLAYYIIIVFP